MTGVTIGTGTFRELADKAAQTFREKTGFPCLVIGDEHLSKYKVKFPHHLKYHIFDIVDSECVFYFDSDLWWLRDWNPRLIAEKSQGGIAAVRDLNRSGHISMDAEGFSLELDKYFNSGFLVLHRDPGKYLLSVAKGCYDRIIEKLDPTTVKLKAKDRKGKSLPFWVQFKDQTSVNMAAQIMDIPIHYVDRRYNWVQSAGEWINKGMPVIGAHKIHRDLKTPRTSTMDFSKCIAKDFENFLSSDTPAPVEVCEEEYARLSGKYLYSREGVKYASYEIYLREDGTIKDSGLLEQWWYPIKSENGICIWVTGHTGLCWKEYLTFKAFFNSETNLWEGIWEEFEKSPVSLKNMEK